MKRVSNRIKNICLIFTLIGALLTVFEQPKVFSDTITPVTVTLKAKVKMKGTSLENRQFQFRLLYDNQEIDTAVSDNDGNVVFSPLTIDRPGNFQYSIVQQPLQNGEPIQYDLSERKVTVSVTKQDLTEVSVEKKYYGTSIGDDSHIVMGENSGGKDFQVFCINQNKVLPPNKPSGRTYSVLKDPTTQDLERTVTQNLYGTDLGENLKKIFFYFQLNPGKHTVHEQKNIVWAATGGFGTNLGQYGDLLGEIFKLNLPTEYHLVVFNPDEDDDEKGIYQSLAMGYGATVSYKDALNASLSTGVPEFENTLDTPKPPVDSKTKVNIRKYAEGDYSMLLSGATLKLKQVEGTGFVEKTFDSNALGESLELPNGVYLLSELKAPKGYEIAEPITFKVSDGQVQLKQGNQYIENPHKEVDTPYSFIAYNDFNDAGMVNLDTHTPYGKFYYAKNHDGTDQIVYCFNVDLHSPPDSYDNGESIDPDIVEGKEVKYTHVAGNELFKYAFNPRDKNPQLFLKHIKKVIEKGLKSKGQVIEYSGLTEVQLRAATQLAIYYFTDSANLDNLKGYHGFDSLNSATLAVAKILVEYAKNEDEPRIENLDFFVPNSNKYQSLVGTSYHPDDLVDVIRMEDKKQEVIPVTHSLTVQKTVVGELGDKTKGFQFELELKDKTGQPIVDALKTNNQDLVAKDGKYSFNLKHGETIRIEGLPTGYSYTLKETEAKDYIVTVDNKVSQEAQSVGKDITEDKKVAFENRKDLVPPTGLTTDGAIYLWLLSLVPFGLLVWLFGRKGLKHD